MSKSIRIEELIKMTLKEIVSWQSMMSGTYHEDLFSIVYKLLDL